MTKEEIQLAIAHNAREIELVDRLIKKIDEVAMWKREFVRVDDERVQYFLRIRELEEEAKCMKEHGCSYCDHDKDRGHCHTLS